jgi:hypothetical protein
MDIEPACRCGSQGRYQRRRIASESAKGKTVNFIAWIKSKSMLTHSVAAFCLTAAGVITFDPQVQQLLIALLVNHPKLVADIILLAAVVAKYSPSRSPAGTLVAARDIKDSGDAPTAKQVDAADTSIKQP